MRKVETEIHTRILAADRDCEYLFDADKGGYAVLTRVPPKGDAQTIKLPIKVLMDLVDCAATALGYPADRTKRYELT